MPARAGWFWVVQTMAQVTGALPLPGMKFPTSLLFFLHLLNQLYLDPGAFWGCPGDGAEGAALWVLGSCLGSANHTQNCSNTVKL